MEINEMIARINILARKKRSEGLTEEEQCEQKALYKEYLGFILSLIHISEPTRP